MDVPTLLELWHGDDSTTGYWHAGLAAEIARLTQPMSDVSLINTIYDGIPIGELEPDAVSIIRDGWQLHIRRKKALQHKYWPIGGSK